MDNLCNSEYLTAEREAIIETQKIAVEVEYRKRCRSVALQYAQVDVERLDRASGQAFDLLDRAQLIYEWLIKDVL